MCDINHDDCYPGACHNNGTCIDRVGGFECKCPAGFVGPRCEGDINECLSNPCNPFGTLDCVQLVNNYHCNCKPGYMGKQCETKVNFCEHSPCLNGGVCSALENRHTCHCNEGYFGTNCEFFGRNGCDPNPCSNRGTCIPLEGDNYRCECRSGLYSWQLWFTVEKCEEIYRMWFFSIQELTEIIAKTIRSTSARLILAWIMGIARMVLAITLVTVVKDLEAKIAKYVIHFREVASMSAWQLL